MANVDKKEMLARLAEREPKLLAGINAILDDKVVFDALSRATVALSNAKNDTNLTAVEASLQTMINDVKKLHASGSPFMNEAKTSFYLYTLQNLVFSLSDWQFANGNENHFVPVIAQKYGQAVAKGAELGVDEDTVRKECFRTDFQDKTDPYLRDFEFLDADRVDNVLTQFQKVQLNKNALGETEKTAPAPAAKAINEQTATAGEIDHGIVKCTDVNVAILDKVINVIKTQFGNEKLDLAYIKDNLPQFFDMVGTVMRTEDRNAIAKVTEAIVRRVLTFEQTMAAVHENTVTADMTVGG